MRMSDWISYVCSSDLLPALHLPGGYLSRGGPEDLGELLCGHFPHLLQLVSPLGITLNHVPDILSGHDGVRGHMDGLQGLGITEERALEGERGRAAGREKGWQVEDI